MDSDCQLRRCQELAGLIGEAPALRKMIEQIPVLANSGATVLISGETGTGKELVARAIHYLSPRAEFPFVAVNCGSLPDTLLEDELFGHERGAFTNADSRREGVIGEAEKGTLFLDEVDTLAPKAQVDLLRVLQDKKYRAIGSSRERHADVRIVAATNAPIEQLLRSGNFRTDLYYRLCVFSIQLPPLRSRKDDIPALAEHFLKKHAPAARGTIKFTPAAIQALLSCDWPGNVRELENAVVRSIHLSRNQLIEPADLGIATCGESTAAPVDTPSGHWASFSSMKRSMIEVFERDYLTRLMAQCRGNVTQAARLAGKERRDLGKLLKRYKLDPKSFRPSIAESPSQV